MTPTSLVVVLAALAAVAFWLGRSRSLATVGGPRGIRNLHSLPSYYGALTAVWCAVPALLVLGVWVAFQEPIIMRLVVSHLPPEARALDPSQLGLLLNDVHNVV